MVKERLKSIDCIKGITILLVVFGHSIQYLIGSDLAFQNRLFNYIYSFHMPLFMFISGFVSYKIIESSDGIIRRAYQLLPPFFFCSLFASIIFSGKYEIDTLINLFKRPEGGLWFLYVLFLISTYFTTVRLIIQKWFINKNKIQYYKTEKCQSSIIAITGLLFFVTCSFLALWFRNNPDIQQDYGTTLMAQHSIFYFTGMISKVYSEKIIYIIKKYWFVFMFLWIILASFWEFGHKPSFIENPNLITEMSYYYLTAFAGIFMMFSLCFKLVNQDSNGIILSFLTYLGTITLGIYAIHLSFVIILVSDIISHLNLNYWISVFAVFFITSLCSIVLVKIIDRGVLAPQLLLGKIKKTGVNRKD